MAYETSGAWPTAADGDGYSLVRIRPTAPADTPTNWRPSTGPGGNPGDTDSVSLATWLPGHGFQNALDSGADGLPALIAFLCGTDLSGLPGAGLVITPENGSAPPTALVTFRHRLAADQVTLQVQSTADFIAWQTLDPGSAAAPIVARVSHGDGTESMTVRIAAPTPSFVRLKAIVP